MERRQMKKLITLKLIAAMALSSGCASTLVYKNSKQELTERRAIRAVSLGEESAGIGLDVAAIDVLSEHPWQQAGAALLDLGLMYGSYAGAKALTDSSDKKEKRNANNNASAGDQVNLNGDGNTVYINKPVVVVPPVLVTPPAAP